MPKISVIVPVFNVERYLGKCIDSVLMQTFTDFELILVDDGSTDSSGAICDEYAEKDSRIKVIHKENGGLSSARNAGIDKASGSYLCFVDSDDTVNLYMLYYLILFAEKERADITECLFDKVYEGEESVGHTSKAEKTDEKCGEAAVVALYDGTGFSPVAWNKLYSARLFKDLKYPEGVTFEDSYLTPRLFYIADKVVRINYHGYNYLQRSGSITKTESELKNTDKIKVYLSVRDFLKEHRLYTALEHNDALLAFVMVKSLIKLKQSGKNCDELKKLTDVFDGLLGAFLHNKVLNRRSKVILIFYTIKLHC